MKIPDRVMFNTALTELFGEPVILMDALPVEPGDRLRIEFVSATSARREGIWLGLEGMGVLDGAAGAQFVLWAGQDRPPQSILTIHSTEDGLLRLNNIWDGGRGALSQTDFCGMLRVDDGVTSTYRCTDVGTTPTFDSLVFTVSRDA